MTLRGRLVLLFTLGLLLAAAAAAADGDSRIVVEKGRQASDMIIAIGTSVVVDGTAARGVVAAGSTVTVAGRVEGDVAVIGGALVLTDTGQVTGNVLLIGSTQNVSAKARIDGKLFASPFLGEDVRLFFTDPFGYLFSQSYDPFSIAKRIFFSLAWFVLAMIIIKLFPTHVAYASNLVRKDFWMVLGTGVLGAVGAFALLVLFILLCLVLIGIPLLAALVVFFLCAWVFGATVFLCTVGNVLARWLKIPGRKPLFSLLLAIAAWTLLKFVPGLAFFVQLLIMTAGIGISLATHFGKGTPWFRSRAAKAAAAR